MNSPLSARLALTLGLLLGPSLSWAQDAPATKPVLEAEASDVALLPPQTPYRIVLGGWTRPGFQIVNGSTAKVEATLHSSRGASFAMAPDGKQFYVAETMWTRINRGKREDLVSIYDGSTLKLIKEVTIPGRLLVTPFMSLFDLSADGKRAYVYDMEPASSVSIVDLAAQKLLSTVEVPGCALVFPWGNNGFASLCGDGSLASVVVDAAGKAKLTHSPAFFDADNDPIFEGSVVDRASATGYFISYSGMIYPAKLGEKPVISDGWPVQKAAGLSPATQAADHETWRPGGQRILAWHKSSGLLYVLMHEGKPWTHKEAGSEVWVIDPTERKVLRRLAVPQAAMGIAISQNDEALLYAVSPAGKLWMLDSKTGKVVRTMDGVQYFTMAVSGF